MPYNVKYRNQWSFDFLKEEHFSNRSFSDRLAIDGTSHKIRLSKNCQIHMEGSQIPDESKGQIWILMDFGF